MHFNSLFSNYHKNSRNNYQFVWPSQTSAFQSNFQFLPGNFEFENLPKLNFSKTFLNRKETEDECSKNMSPKDKIKSSLIPPNKELLIKPTYIKNKNDELIKNTTENQNSSKKFFTDYNSGYRCSCSKTQCNRKYCECYNSHRYCFGCNCKNCQNLPPKNSFTNKHPDEVEKEKKNNEVIICTCTKSGCNKKYCECYKNGNKCSELCRCIGCENTDKFKNENNSKKVNLNDYQCCTANSVYIVKNELNIEKISNGKIVKNDAIEEFTKKKRKREAKLSLSEQLFDENGKVILRHINLIGI